MLQCIISQLDKISSAFVDSQHICMQLYASFVEKNWKNDGGTEAGTEEGRIAGNYIASLLQQWGVSPVFDSYSNRLKHTV